MAKRWDTEDGDSLLTYNALDAVATARVDQAIIQEEDWPSPRVQRLYDTHRILSIIGGDLHTTGFYVYETDKDIVKQLGKNYKDKEGSKLARSRESLAAELEALSVVRKKALVAHVGAPEFRGTDNDMRALLYNRHRRDGIPCYDIEEPDPWDNVMWTNDQCTTLAVDKEALLRVLIDPKTQDAVKDAITLFWRAKAPGKAEGTWVMSEDVLSKVGEDGRMRADWNSAGTETMRWASELMTLPQAKDDTTLGGALPNMRAMYGVPKGYVLYHWDWKSQELRMLWAISKDAALGEALASGNVYIADARAWFPKQLEQLLGPTWATMDTKSFKKAWPDGYRQCKVGHLAAQYMAGTPAMWTQALVQDRGISFAKMKLIREMFHKRYHQTVRYAEEEHARVMKSGYSEGRILRGRRYYPAPPVITETCNFPVQRTAGEMGALTMIAIWSKLKKYKVKAKILTNEHDAGTMEVHDDAKTRRVVSDIVKECAQGPWEVEGAKYDFPVDDHWGYSWADACSD